MKRIVFEVQDTEEFFTKLKELFLPEIRTLFQDEFSKIHGKKDQDLLTPKQGMDWLFQICGKGRLSSWANS